MTIIQLFRLLQGRSAVESAVASHEYIGRFAWSESWGRWYQILNCRAEPCGRSWWTVREIGTLQVRTHCTRIAVDCICDKPIIREGRHLPPDALRFAA